MKQPIRVDFLLRAESPIAHHAEVTGNIATMMREDLAFGDMTHSVPIITGDAMRHGLRAASASLALEAAGIETGLGESAVRFLYNGGGIGGQPGATVDVKAYREMVEIHPALALLGGCVDNRILAGSVQVGRAMLVCSEAVDAGVLPAWVHEGAPEEIRRSCVAWVDEVMRTRMEPLMQPGKRALAGAEADDYLERLIAGQATNTMMPRTFEVVKAGGVFWWSVNAQPINDIQRDAFYAMIGRFLSNPTVGGKRGSGFGRLSLVRAWGCAAKPARIDASEISMVDVCEDAAERHAEYMANNAARLAELLRKVKS